MIELLVITIGIASLVALGMVVVAIGKVTLAIDALMDELANWDDDDDDDEFSAPPTPQLPTDRRFPQPSHN